MEKQDAFDQWDSSPTRASPTRKSNINEQEDSTSPPRHSSADAKPARKKRASFVHRQQGKPYLGMTTAEKVDEVTQKKTIAVTSVDIGSLSCLAGITEGDILMTWQVEGDVTERVLTTHEELVGAYNNANVGDKVNLFVKKPSGKTVVCKIDFGIKDLRMELEELKMMLERKESQCDQYILDLSVMSTSIDSLKTQNKDLQTTVERLKLLAESETVYVKEVTEIKSKYEDLRGEFESYRRKVEAQMSEEVMNCKSAIKQRDALQAIIDELTKDKEKGEGKFKSRISELDTELSSLKLQLAAGAKDKQGLKDQYQALIDEHATYRKSIEIKLKDETSRTSSLDGELVKLRKTIESSNKTILDLEGRLLDSQTKYTSIEKSKGDLQKQLEALQNEFAAFRKQAEGKLRDEVAAGEERSLEIDRLKKQISKLESQHKSALAELQMKLDSVSTQYSNSEKNRNELNVQLTVINEEFSNYKKLMEAKLRESASKNHDLELELESLKKAFARQEGALKDKVKELESQLEAVRAQHSTSHKLTIELQHQLSSVQDEFQTYKKQMEIKWKDENQRNQELERELEKLRKAAAVKESQLNDRINELERQVDALKSQLGASEKVKGELSNQLTSLQAEFNEYRRQSDSRLKQEQQRSESLEADVDRLSKLEFQYKEAALALEFQISSLKSQIQSLEKAKAELESSLDSAASEKRQLEARIRELIQALADSNSENEKLNSSLHLNSLKIKTLTSTVEDLEALNNELKDNARAAKKQVAELEEEVAALNAKVDGLLAQLKALQSENNNDSQAKDLIIKELRVKQTQLLSTIDSLNLRINSLEPDNVNLRRANQALQAEIGSMRLELDELANKIRNLKSENANYHARYSELEECLQSERILKNELLERSKLLNDELLDLKERFARQIQTDSNRTSSEASQMIERLQSEISEQRMIINNFNEKEKTLISQYEYLLLTCKQENEGLELIIKTQKIEIDKFNDEVQLMKLQAQSLSELRKQIELKDGENASLQQTLVISVEKQLILHQQLTDLRLRVDSCAHHTAEQQIAVRSPRVVEFKETSEIEDFRMIIAILEKIMLKISTTTLIHLFPILKNECFQLRLAFERVESHILASFNNPTPYLSFGGYRDGYSYALQ